MYLQADTTDQVISVQPDGLDVQLVSTQSQATVFTLERLDVAACMFYLKANLAGGRQRYCQNYKALGAAGALVCDRSAASDGIFVVTDDSYQNIVMDGSGYMTLGSSNITYGDTQSTIYGILVRNASERGMHGYFQSKLLTQF